MLAYLTWLWQGLINMINTCFKHLGCHKIINYDSCWGWVVTAMPETPSLWTGCPPQGSPGSCWLPMEQWKPPEGRAPQRGVQHQEAMANAAAKRMYRSKLLTFLGGQVAMYLNVSRQNVSLKVLKLILLISKCTASSLLLALPVIRQLPW